MGVEAAQIGKVTVEWGGGGGGEVGVGEMPAFTPHVLFCQISVHVKSGLSRPGIKGSRKTAPRLGALDSFIHLLPFPTQVTVPSVPTLNPSQLAAAAFMARLFEDTANCFPVSFFLCIPTKQSPIRTHQKHRGRYRLVLSLLQLVRAHCVRSFLLTHLNILFRPLIASTIMASAAAARNTSSVVPPRTPRTSPPRRVLRLALGGDTMLGRCVAEAILQARDPPDAPKDTERTKMPFPPGGSAFGTPPRKPKEDEAVVFTPEVVALAHEADLFFLNLECCITNHHQRWPNPHKPFFFRAPFCSVKELKILGVDAVTLANNHALDYDMPGLDDTLETLDEAGIPYTGAGRNLVEARQPVILEHESMRIGIIGVTDHPLEFDAKADRPGVCYVDLQRYVLVLGFTPCCADIELLPSLSPDF